MTHSGLQANHESEKSYKKGRKDQHNKYGSKLTRPRFRLRLVRFLFISQAHDIDTKSKMIMPLNDFSIGRRRLIDLVEDAAVLKVLLLRFGPSPEQRIVDGHELDVREAGEIVGIDRLRV